MSKGRAAIIATAATLPIIIIVALLLGSLGGGSSDGSGAALPALTPSPPPLATAQAKPCTDLLQALPLQLNGLDPRRVTTTPFVLAWGDPAIVLSCGVAKPAALYPGSDDRLTNAGGDLAGAFYDVTSSGSSQIYTAVDRAAFVSIAVPSKYPGGVYLAILNRAILKAMPKAVCATDPSTPDPDTLCTRRK